MNLPVNAQKSDKTVPTIKNATSGQIFISSPRHHHVRTIAAAISGIIALNLIIASILMVWLNRTLTDTNTYVSTVAPLVTEPDIQEFITAKTTDQLIKNVPSQEIAAVLLEPDDIAGKTPEQLQESGKTELKRSVLAAVQSPDFKALWLDTNRTAHSDIVGQLEGNTGQLSIDASPLVVGVLTQLKETELAPIVAQVDIPEGVGHIKLDGPVINQLQEYYRLLQTATLVLLVATLFTAGLCVLMSVHHARTFRRILIGTGLATLVLALLIQLPALVSVGTANPADQRAAAAFAGVLFHDLRTSLLIISVLSFIVALSSKLYSNLRHHPE